ncbi:MAG: dihydrolipoyl dehydrogenase [Bacteroidaceae bacterium]|nr:dihydrolipoyl dehydrogenase [Bacteroidaceae bacterium]
MTDLIIIGAGPGGYETAVRAARQGLNVTIVEAATPGGTCLNEGCIPTKCLCRSAEVLSEANEAAVFGVLTGSATFGFDLATAIARKDTVVAQLVQGVRGLLATPGITLIEGRAALTADRKVRVEQSDGTVETLEAKHIILATGSETKFLPIPGAHGRDVVTSTELLQHTAMPRRLCVIGGGVIGMEFASIFNAFGAEVTVVEYCKEILPAIDKDIAKRLRTSMKKRGVDFHVGAAVTAVEELAEGSCVVFTEKGKEQRVEADVVLMAVGRAPRTAGLGLEEAGVDFTPRGITVDADMRTTAEGIYAIGDVNGLCPLAHAATFQGYRALRAIAGGTERTADLSLVPAAVFTVPEVATVGKSEDELKTAGTPCHVGKAFYRANGKSLAMGSDEGLVKLVSAEDGTILGAQVLGAHAADLIHEVAVLMSVGGTVEQLRTAIHAHPTLSELILAAAE